MVFHDDSFGIGLIFTEWSLSTNAAIPSSSAVGGFLLTDAARRDRFSLRP